ncbi:hypothetical protein MHYP_G00011520 [Metynnis hypsauchen]
MTKNKTESMRARGGGARHLTDSSVGCCGRPQSTDGVPVNGQVPVRLFDVLIGGMLWLSGRVQESMRGWTGPCPTSCFYLLWTSVAPTTTTRLSASSPTQATRPLHLVRCPAVHPSAPGALQP